jgi:hypothetical protein
MARPSRVPAWIGCTHHGKLHRRTDNSVPPRRNREEYRALMRRGHAPHGTSRRQDPSWLRCHLSHQHPRPYARCGGPVQPKAARPSPPRQASNGLPVSIVPARNESRTNRARIADSPLGGFVHGHISWRRKYIPQHRVRSALTIIAVAANCPTVEFAAGSSTGSAVIGGRFARPRKVYRNLWLAFIASWRWSCSDAGARRTGSPA